MKNKILKRKRISMQSYLIGILVSTIVIQGVVILGTLISRDFYTYVDEQILENFSTRSDQQITDVNEKMTANVKQVISLSQDITSIYEIQASENHKTLSEIDLSQSGYDKSHTAATQILLDTLDKCVVDSVFLNLSYDGFEDDVFVELVNTYPELQGDGYQAYQIRTGSTLISKTYELGIHKQWELTLDEEDSLKDCYTMPLKAMEMEPYGNLEQYGYWNYNENGSRNGEVTYSIPLINELGESYGVVGIGISKEYFENHYVNAEHYSYGDNFYAVAIDFDGVMIMNNDIINTKYAKDNLETNFLIEERFSQNNVYEVKFKDYGNSMVKVDRLNMYSSNSPFVGQELSYLTIISAAELQINSNNIKDIFSISFGIAVIVSILLSLVIAKISTVRINSLSKSIKAMSVSEEIEFKSTGFTEIDDLTDAIKVLNDKAIKSNQTLNHLFKLTELNIGGFESQGDGTVRITQYVSKLLELGEKDVLSIQEWNGYFKQLTKEMIDKEKKIYIYSCSAQTSYLKVTQTTDSGEFIGMILDVTKEIEDVIEAQYKLDYDALTKLHSRTAFYRKVNELIDRDPYKVGCVVFIDLDNLKFVNDTFGHEYGDMYLVEGSKIFERMAKNNGIAARMSGDEFAVYLHGFYSKDEIRQLLYMHFEDSKLAAIELPDGSEQRVRFSSGIAWYGDDSKDVNELVKYADFAMYDAKHTIKGTHREFNKEVYNEKIYMMENTEAINELIEEKKVNFMFQPIVSLKTGEIYAYEALMRSDLEVFKSPAEILKVASAQFKLKELEQMLVYKAIQTAYENKELIQGAKVFVNSIASQMMSIDSLQKMRLEYGDFLNQIVIEITEEEDNTPEKMKQKVETIKSFGMEVAIDDFGSGYSNELRIIAIDPDVVKLDMELIQGISEDTDKQVLCNNIISYCHSRNIRTVCEGVECFEDLKMIKELGSDLVQGYYVQKPSFDVQDIPQNIKTEIVNIVNK